MTQHLYDHLHSFQLLHDREPCTLIFHTSAVRLPEEQLKRILTLNYRFLLPDNVYYELRLLQDSVYPLFQKNAEQLLAAVPKASFSLEELYQYNGNCRQKLRRILPEGKILFLFDNTGEMEELARLLPPEREVYFLNIGTYKAERIDYPYPLQLLKQTLAEKETLRPVEFGQRADLKDLAPNPAIYSQIYLCDHKGNTHRILNGADLSHEEQLVGAEAGIYTHRDCPGRLLKIYKKAIDQARYTKVLTFCQEQNCYSSYVAMPKELLLLEDGTMIGFAMPRFEGALLGEVIDRDWLGFDRQQVLRNLMREVLQLRILEINIPDISRRNFMVGKDNRVYLLDCDSFEAYACPVAALTELYAHPELYKMEIGRHLRRPHHLNFALSVLLFQCMSGIYNPVHQIRRDPAIPLNWQNHAFPYDIDRPIDPSVNPRPYFEQWAGLSREVQAGFADEFHLRCTQSIGAWIRRLNLC